MNFIAGIKQNKLEYLIALFFPVLMLIPQKAGLFILLIALCLLYMFYHKEIKFRWNRFGTLFVLLYIGYAVGCFWSDHPSDALKYLEYKLSFLLFPILFSFDWNGKTPNVNIVLWGLIGGVILSFIVGIAMGIPCYLHYGSFPYCFIKAHLSPLVHPTYISVYTTFAIAGTYYLMKKKKLSTVGFVLIVSILTSYLFLLMSLAGLLFFGMLILVFFVNILFKYVSKIRAITLLVIGLSISIYGITTAPFLKGDIAEASRKLSFFMKEPKRFIDHVGEIPTGTETRLILWYVSVEEIMEHPFGVGTANIDDHISANLIEKGKTELSRKLYNPHNQFFQTWLEIGVFGFVILCLICFGGLYTAFRNRNNWLVLLFSSLIVNSLFESMLQMQAGIIFYTLMFFVFNWFPTKETFELK